MCNRIRPIGFPNQVSDTNHRVWLKGFEGNVIPVVGQAESVIPQNLDERCTVDLANTLLFQ